MTRENKLIMPSRRHLLATAGTTLLCAPTVLRAAINSEICVPDLSGGSVPAFVEDSDFTAVTPKDLPGERRIFMFNGRTGESYDRIYVKDGQFDQDALAEYNNFCRDWRTNQIKQMHPGLLDIIFQLSDTLGTGTTPWSLTSGYRSPATNAKLDGTATRSLHMSGMANDLVHPHKSPSKVYKQAMTIGAGGVGSYVDFTHVDTGGVRTWRG